MALAGKKVTDKIAGGIPHELTVNDISKPTTTTDLPVTNDLKIDNSPPPGSIAATDPKEFQNYLNQLGAKPPLKVDGLVGAKTLAAAKSLNVTVPPAFTQQQQQPAAQPQQQDNQPQQTQTQQSTVTPAPTLEDPAKWIQDHYADVAPYMAIPALADIIVKASTQNWTPSQIEGAVAATDWWKNTAKATRDWQTLQSSQPAEAQKQIDNKKADIQAKATSEGLTLDDATLTDLATKYLSQGWDDNVLQGQLRASPQWKGVSDATRAWNQLVQQDPAEAQAQRVQKQADVTNMFKAMGVPLDQNKVASISEQALQEGWDATQLKNAVAGGLYAGDAGGKAVVDENTLTQIGKEWGFDISPSEMTTWIQGIANGTLTTQDYQAQLQQRALQTYGSNQGLANAIQNGTSPKAFYQPYADVVNRELGVPVEQQDWKDPKYQVAMNYTDPTTGDKRPMNVDEWQQQIRSNPVYDWKHSRTANDLAGNLTSTILNTFGQVA